MDNDNLAYSNLTPQEQAILTDLTLHAMATNKI
jgi:hypothetical protein